MIKTTVAFLLTFLGFLAPVTVPQQRPAPVLIDPLPVDLTYVGSLSPARTPKASQEPTSKEGEKTWACSGWKDSQAGGSYRDCAWVTK